MREAALLQHVYDQSAGLPDDVVIPPGDDMGAVTLGGTTLLVTTDQVADGVHVDLADTPLGLAGRKCVTRSLSDVAAMAAKPVGAVVAVCLPKGFGEDRAAALFDAMRDTAEHYGCPLVGGDIAMWDSPMIATLTVFAEPAGVEPVLRGGAQPGDAVYVTGCLGGSLASGHHLVFEPRLTLARALAADPDSRPTAMMDLSDGVGMDLPRMVEHAEIDAALLPIRPETPDTPEEPAWRHALGDGEDYELLFTASPDADVPAELLGVTVTRIGEVRDAGGVVVQLPDGSTQPVAGLGWEHRG